MKRRIGFDGRYINDRYHGIGRVAYSLLEAMLRVDDEYDFIIYIHPGYRNSRFDINSLTSYGHAQIREVRVPLLVPTEQFLWPIILARDHVDLFHSPYVVGPVFGRTPTIVTVHDLIFERFPALMPRRTLRQAYRLLAAASIRHAAAVVTVSSATRVDLERCYPAAIGKDRVVPNGVDASFGRVTEPALLSAVAERYRLPSRFVLALGAGRPHKNLGLLIEAARVLDDDIHFVIVSTPDPRFPDDVGAALAKYRLANRVDRIPSVREDDLAAIYSLSTAFVLPSLIEGFGLPMLEGMAAGTPVLAARSSSLPEVGGEAAIYFDPLDAADLARQLRRVLGDAGLRHELAERGRERAMAFTWDAAAGSMRNLYSDLLDARRRR